MAIVAVLVVAALLAGASPGVALIAAATASTGLDRYDPAILDRLTGLR